MYICNCNGGLSRDLDGAVISLYNTRESAMNELNDYLKIASDLGLTIREDLRYGKNEYRDWRVIVTDERPGYKITVMICSVYKINPKD